jgi:hypothetical protein
MRSGSTFLMLLSALALGAVVVAEVRYGAIDALAIAFGAGESRAGEAPTSAARAHLRADAARALPELALLSATRERPLFYEGRTYPEPEPEASAAGGPGAMTDAAPAPVTVPLGAVKLSAIVIVDQQRVALLREPGSAESRYLGVGGSVNGWTVAEIRTDSVLLRNGTSTEELKLWTFEPIPLPGPAARASGAAGGDSERDPRARLHRRLSSQLNERREPSVSTGVPGQETTRDTAPAASGAASTGERDCGLSRC